MAEMTRERIAELEQANYAVTARLAEVTPGLEVMLREDVILNSSELFPTPDTNHACLLRTPPERIEALLDEVIDYYRSRERPVTLYLSPACEPEDLEARLKARGFVAQKPHEAWLVTDLENRTYPGVFAGVEVRQIGKERALLFAELFLRAFKMPAEYAPVMAQLLEPTIGLPDVVHYIAYDGEEPTGTISLLCQGEIGVLGSAGVLMTRRGRGAATNLAVVAAREALARGVRYLILQTAARTLLERVLRIYGFERAFVRHCFVLE